MDARCCRFVHAADSFLYVCYFGLLSGLFVVFFFFFFFTDTAPTEIYTLPLHDALPISIISQQLAELERILAAGHPAGPTLRAIIVNLVETTAARADQALVGARRGGLHQIDDDRAQQIGRAHV